MDSLIYLVSKSLIEKKDYNKEKMKEDLSLFKMFEVITVEEYLDLMKMMGEEK